MGYPTDGEHGYGCAEACREIVSIKVHEVIGSWRVESTLGDVDVQLGLVVSAEDSCDRGHASQSVLKAIYVQLQSGR
jgi:hypothetical protein